MKKQNLINKIVVVVTILGLMNSQTLWSESNQEKAPAVQNAGFKVGRNLPYCDVPTGSWLLNPKVQAAVGMAISALVLGTAVVMGCKARPAQGRWVRPN